MTRHIHNTLVGKLGRKRPLGGDREYLMDNTTVNLGVEMGTKLDHTGSCSRLLW